MTDMDTTLRLIERAREQIIEGYAATASSTRFLAASLGALQAAAALLSAATGARAGGQRVDTWAELSVIAPDLGEWTELFAAATATRIAVETQIVRVSVRQSDDLLRAAEEFVEHIATRIGVPRRGHHLRLAPARTA